MIIAKRKQVWFDLLTRPEIEQRAPVVRVCVGGVMVPPSAQSASTKPRPQQTQTALHLMVNLFSGETSKKKETVCKTVQNQALFFFSFLFFYPASSPFIIAITITIIVVNIIFENITHQRQTARG